VVRTRVGYAGGSTASPTYRNLGDHTETLQIDYDPQKISYGRLLEIFWAGHDARREAWSRQYMSAIFYDSPAQKEAAEKSLAQETARGGGKVYTRILALDRFFRAEDYHQKYYLRQNATLLRDFKAIYPDAREFTDSTAAARVNGYLGGHAPINEVRRRVDDLGLSPEGRLLLLEAAER
jgi:peptide-methionine (S)-S-oxide reductase